MRCGGLSGEGVGRKAGSTPEQMNGAWNDTTNLQVVWPKELRAGSRELVRKIVPNKLIHENKHTVNFTTPGPCIFSAAFEGNEILLLEGKLVSLGIFLRWENNTREWTGLEFAKSQRAVENRGRWRKLVAKSSVVPQRPSRLRNRWDEKSGSRRGSPQDGEKNLIQVL